jgi:hypothetical protein
LPRELKHVDLDSFVVTMEYDARHRGVHIFLAALDSKARTHWWVDWSSKTFWPVAIQEFHEPFAMCRFRADTGEDGGVVLGCSDGYLRRFNNLSTNDDGYTFTSSVMIGPIALGDGVNDGVIKELVATLGLFSSGVTWELYVGRTAEEVLNTSAIATGTWYSGPNFTQRPGGRGQAFGIKLTASATNLRWALENLHVITRSAGRQRLVASVR